MAIKFRALKVSCLSLRFHKKCSKVGDSSISDPLTGSKARLKTSEKPTIGSPLILYDIRIQIIHGSSSDTTVVSTVSMKMLIALQIFLFHLFRNKKVTTGPILASITSSLYSLFKIT